MLEAGFELLREEPVGDVLNQLKSARVARRAGLTEGAFFYHWSSRDAFVEDLLDHALNDSRYASAGDLLAEAAELLAADADLVEVVRRACALHVERLEKDRTFQVQVSLWGKHSLDPGIAERLLRLYRTSDERFAPAYRTFLEAHGLRARPPYTYETMATITNALLEGLVLRRGVDPDAVPVELFGDLVLALLPAVTEPA